VVRREDSGLKHYAHLGTGNYHPRTARQYTDYGLFTADAALCKDVHAVFLQLTSLGKVSKLKYLLQSPFTLSKSLLAKIERETDHAKKDKPASITAKMNALVDPEIIQALYRASQAGVQIELIVRGMCALRPGVKGLSENIRVRSVVGRFLEHHRVFCFHNSGEPELFLSSADWMERNLFRRVEIAFPVLDKKIRERIIEQLQGYLADTMQSWFLQADGVYQRADKPEGKGIQTRMLEESQA
jgi:polyphosphate kinase